METFEIQTQVQIGQLNLRTQIQSPQNLDKMLDRHHLSEKEMKILMHK